MIVVLDASAVIDLLVEPPPGRLGVISGVAARHSFIAPPLMWSEAGSGLHAMAARGRLPAPEARRMLRVLERVLPIVAESPPGLRELAWTIADRMGWVRTDDAEYCALAEMRGAVLATSDLRLVRAAEGRMPGVRTLADVVAALPA